MAGIPTSGELKIEIQMPENAGGELPESTPSPGAPTDEGRPSSNPVSGGKNGQLKLALAASTVKNLGMQAMNASISNIGLSTGNNYLQSQVERNVQTVQSVVGVGLAFWANPIMGAVALAGTGIQAAAETYKQNKEREIANYQAEQYAKRIGFTGARR